MNLTKEQMDSLYNRYMQGSEPKVFKIEDEAPELYKRRLKLGLPFCSNCGGTFGCSKCGNPQTDTFNVESGYVVDGNMVSIITQGVPTTILSRELFTRITKGKLPLD